ncbi:MAG: 1,4-dihydroxy-2-naphthoate octaprenyltransferase [Desulfomonilaceae bacterium]
MTPKLLAQGNKSSLSAWLQAVRTFSFTASMVPVFIGGILAFSFSGSVAWHLFPLVVICSLLFHSATNVISDYFDFSKGVDRDYTFGGSRVILEGLLSPNQVLIGGVLLFAAGVILGVILVAYRGLPILLLGFIGLIGGYFYTGRPVAYKYVALGDLLVFTLMGPLMVIGSYFVLTGTYERRVLCVSLPVGFLVTAILHANNLRDIIHDSQARVKTVANVIGLKAAKFEYFALVGGAYLAVVLMVLAQTLQPLSLIVFLSFPLALRTLKTVYSHRTYKPDAIAFADVQTAQLHLAFGILLGLSMIPAVF